MDISLKLKNIIYRIADIFFKVMRTVSKNKLFIIIMIFVFAYYLGVSGIKEVVELSIASVQVSTDKSIFSSVWFLAFENLFVQLPGELTNTKVITAQFIAHFALLFTVVLVLFKDWIVLLKLKTLSYVKHTLVIGLGENNRMYLESEIKSGHESNIIIIEPDIANAHARYFQNEGFGVFFGTIEEYSIKFQNLERVVISAGNDRENIEIAGKLLQQIPDTMNKEKFGEPTIIHIHLQNQDYKALFKQNVLNSRADLPLEFKPYSFNDDAVRYLFDKHTVLGNFHTIAKREESYNIVVIGDGNLAERIIYHLCTLSILPNKNHLTVHCINENTESFITRVKSNFTELSKIKSISFHEHHLSMENPNFFNSDVWALNNLTNVFICHDDENINLECVVNLHDKVYIKDAVHKTMKTKVHFAMYHNMQLSQSIDENKDEFKQFFTFGDASKICSREYFIDENHENIAKLIHNGYGDIYNDKSIGDFEDKIFVKIIESKWLDSTKFSDRESNRSQALHINTKLMSLGLKKVKYDDTDKTQVEIRRLLLKENKKAFKPFCSQLKITQKELVNFSSQLPKLYDDESHLDEEMINKYYEILMKDEGMLAKLMQAEHERWNAFHYINGWKFNKDKNKDIKEHNCLISLGEFNDVKRKMTIIYDLYSVLYMPNYLASTGYKIVPIDDISIGVIGNSDKNMPDDKLKNILKIELEKIISKHGNIELISSLREGTERIFVDLALEVDIQKIKELTVPMPFEEEDYIQDFNQNSSKDMFTRYTVFDEIYSHMKVDAYSLTHGSPRTQKNPEKQNNFNEQQYMKSREDVLKLSDIVFLILNKQSDDIRTKEVLTQAKKYSKKIICINPRIYDVCSKETLDIYLTGD
ncbi:hypothetical protein [Candidatus Sulfurimonas baltica]|uniref:RCK N-terminal domain-containing protein n=1 Tax=Candidatus Sulfurimonas baltica TaxID=2740404 RepID=A0A7S7RP87_9BACT|nr:hypothetical protein [Candidatus Sulfurimonas baltica]QOY53233.1 hypothetical protein HUE88_06015 [Candidatus Sulfurimonas baltica]